MGLFGPGPNDDDWAQEAAAAVAAHKEAEDEANTTLKQLYVGNLDRRVSDVLLFRIFSLWGQVELCKVIKERGSDLSLGYGFVGYYSHEDAQRALAASTGCTVYERELRVRWAHSDSTRKHGASAGAKHTLFVGDLGVGVTDLMLTEAFAKFGECIEARVVRNPDSGKSRGYGFVSYLHQAQAERALAAMNGAWLGSRNIRVNWSSGDAGQASPLSSSSSSSSMLGEHGEAGNSTVYVGNLGPGADERMIAALFQPFGSIVEIRHQPGSSFGFVVYADSAAAATAISTLGGRRINDRTLRCAWGKDHAKTDARQSLPPRYPRQQPPPLPPPPSQPPPAASPMPGYPVHPSRYAHFAPRGHAPSPQYMPAPRRGYR